MANPKIVSFAAAMVRAMKENEGEKGDSWTRMSTAALLNRITKNLRGVRTGYQIYGPRHPRIKKHLVDIGNYAMMLFSRFEEEGKNHEDL